MKKIYKIIKKHVEKADTVMRLHIILCTVYCFSLL